MDLTLLSFWLSLALRLQINQFPLQLKRIYGIFKTNNEGSFDSIIKLKNDIQISAMQYASLQIETRRWIKHDELLFEII